MTIMSDLPISGPGRGARGPALSWTAIILGALVGTALSFILVGFGVAVGLGVSSSAPSWRDASIALWLLSGIYLILQALVSFAVAGYIAGWLASHSHVATTDIGSAHADGDLTEALHGLAAWALAVVLGAALAGIVGSATLARSTPNTPAAQNTAAEPMLSYELDRLFRSPRRGPSADLTAERAEAGRILLTSSSQRGVLGDDRSYLVQLVSGTGGPDAERRVDNAIESSRQALSRARAGSIILAFSVASALLLGAVAAWMAAAAGAQYRDGVPVPFWTREKIRRL